MLMKKIKLLVTEKMNLSFEMHQDYQHSLKFSDLQDFEARIKITDFPVDCFLIDVNLSVQICMTEIKPVVIEKHEFKTEMKRY